MAGPLDDLIAQGASGVIPAASIGVPTGEAPVTGLTPRQVLAGAGATKMQTPVMPSVNRAIPNPTVPATGGYPAGGYASEAERRADIARMAKERGLDQAQVDRLIGSEGGYATFDARQDSGTSFGPFAMHIAGKLPGTTAPGLGDEFRKATGLDPSLPQNERALNAFAMDQLKIHGFDPNIWHGLRAAGVSVGDMAAQVRRVQADQGAAAGRLDATAQGLIKQIGSERGSLAESMSRVRAAQDKADQANDAALAAISKAPAQPEIDGVKQLNGLAVLVGVLGGLFTKSPMRTSINAAASAIEAYNDHDREKYQVAYNNWKTQTGLLFKIADMTQSRVRDILYDEQMGANERNALLDTTLRAAGLSQLADQARTQGDSVVLDWMEKMQSAKIAHDDRMEEAAWRHKFAELQLGTPKNEAQVIQGLVNKWIADVTEETGRAPSTEEQIAKFEAIRTAMHPTAATTKPQPITVTDKDGKQVYAGMATYDPDKKLYTAVGQSEPFGADMTVKADSGRPARSPPAIYLQKWIEEHPGATAEDISRASANYTHAQTVERAFGAGPIARNVQALNTVADHIKTVRAYADALNNGDIPRANALLNRLSVESGYETVTNFQTAANIMADEVVRLLTSTGGTETDRRNMEAHFSQNMSPAQIGGALDVAEHMVAGRFKALEQGYAANDPARRKYFESDILTQDARDLFARNHGAEPSGNVGSASSGAAPAATKPPPPGAIGQRKNPDGTTTYVMPDGSQTTQ